MKVTTSTKFTFGKYKNVKLRDVPNSYLEWVIKNLNGTDFHEWSVASKEEQNRRKTDNAEIGDLEAQADAILRQAGFDPHSCRH